MGHPKTKLEFLKNVIDSLDYKEIEAFIVAINKGIYCKFVSIETNQPLVAQGHGQYAQSVICQGFHAKSSLNFDLALCSI